VRELGCHARGGITKSGPESFSTVLRTTICVGITCRSLPRERLTRQPWGPHSASCLLAPQDGTVPTLPAMPRTPPGKKHVKPLKAAALFCSSTWSWFWGTLSTTTPTTSAVDRTQLADPGHQQGLSVTLNPSVVCGPRNLTQPERHQYACRRAGHGDHDVDASRRPRPP
jgi:hypothetical protein